MTGVGSARGSTEAGEIAIEVRTVNGRGLSVKTRLPASGQGWETALERRVRGRLARGSATVVVDQHGAAGVEASIDPVRAEQCARELRALAERLSLPGPSLSDVLALPGVVGSGAARASELPAAVASLLEQALDALIEDRRREGAATARALRAHVAALAGLRDRAAQRAASMSGDYRDRLRQRVAEAIAEHGVTLTDADLVREVAVFAERADVSEELHRIETHVRELGQLLAAGGEVGRKLEFLAQELLREVNTVGSKSPDAEMAHLVVDMKAAIDKVKEQASNLE